MRASIGQSGDVVVRSPAEPLHDYLNGLLTWAGYSVVWQNELVARARSRHAGSLDQSRWAQIDVVLFAGQPPDTVIRLQKTGGSGAFATINLVDQRQDDLPGLIRLVADGIARGGLLVGVFPSPGLVL